MFPEPDKLTMIIADAVAWSQGVDTEDKHICNAEDVLTRLREQGYAVVPVERA